MPPIRSQESRDVPTFRQFCHTGLVLLDRRVGTIAFQAETSSSDPQPIFARLLACDHIIVYDSRRPNHLDRDDFIFQMKNTDDEGQRRLNSCPEEQCGRSLWKVDEPDTVEIWRVLKGTGATMSVAGLPTDELVGVRRGEEVVKMHMLRRTTVAALMDDGDA